MKAKPLIVDLDGTLLKSDLLLETAVAYIYRNILRLFHLPLWLMQGKAHLKGKLARNSDLDVAALPYNEPLLDMLKSQKAAGRRIVLATASHMFPAMRIADYLGCFDEVIATEERNLKGVAKRDELVRRYGEKGFDYVANDISDLPVWAAADKAYLVNASADVEARARAQGNVASVTPSPEGGRLKLWLNAARLYQWVKNLLIFVPLVAAHGLRQGPYLAQAVLAFLFFGLCASGTYLINDLIDLPHDRRHRSKRGRAFASGALPLCQGAAVAALLLFAAFAGALLLLPAAFTLVLALYFLLTLAYSLYLKRIMMLDVIVLAGLYTMRIIAGTVVTGNMLTFWLLAFSVFMFLSLALVKRYAELYKLRQRNSGEFAGGRGYTGEDSDIVSTLGVVSGYLSVLVLAFYIQDPATTRLYHHPQLIWLACPLLLYWIGRVWMLAHRGQMQEDPILFALKDKSSLIAGALFVIIFGLAT